MGRRDDHLKVLPVGHADIPLHGLASDSIGAGAGDRRKAMEGSAEMHAGLERCGSGGRSRQEAHGRGLETSGVGVEAHQSDTGVLDKGLDLLLGLLLLLELALLLPLLVPALLLEELLLELCVLQLALALLERPLGEQGW